MRLTEGVVRGQELSSNHDELQAGHDHHLLIMSQGKGRKQAQHPRTRADVPIVGSSALEGTKVSIRSRSRGMSQKQYNRILVLLGHDVKALCLVSGDG